MEKKYTKLIQVLIDEDTLFKLNRLIAIDALDNNEKPKTKSKWLRELITDTINFEFNAKKIEEYKPRHKK